MTQLGRVVAHCVRGSECVSVRHAKGKNIERITVAAFIASAGGAAGAQLARTRLQTGCDGMDARERLWLAGMKPVWSLSDRFASAPRMQVITVRVELITLVAR